MIIHGHVRVDLWGVKRLEICQHVFLTQWRHAYAWYVTRDQRVQVSNPVRIAAVWCGIVLSPDSGFLSVADMFIKVTQGDVKLQPNIVRIFKLNKYLY